MRKSTLALALLLALCFATTAHAFSFDWGVTGGMNLSKVKLHGASNDYFNSDNRTGWFVVAKANVGLFLGFGLDGALLYSQQKLNFSDDYDSSYSYSKTHRSIDIPINLKYSIGLGSVAAVYVATGPQFEFNVGNKDYSFGSEDYLTTFKRENMTTSWNIGIGTRILSHLDLGLTYNFGISKVGETLLGEMVDNRPNWESNEAKVNTFKVQLTYSF